MEMSRRAAQLSHNVIVSYQGAAPTWAKAMRRLIG
jgi:hypothetical protein